MIQDSFDILDNDIDISYATTSFTYLESLGTYLKNRCLDLTTNRSLAV